MPPPAAVCSGGWRFGYRCYRSGCTEPWSWCGGTCDPDDTCDGTTNACAAVYTADGTTCDDGNACTIDDACDDSGQCVGTPDTGTSCTDGNACTIDDACDASGQCVGTPIPDSSGTTCDDGSRCTINDVCLAGGICQGTPNTGASCNDSNACTINDACNDSGQCVGTPNTSASCTDGLSCTTGDTCDGSGMCVGTPVDCSSVSDVCHTGTCNEPNGTCSATPKPDGTSCGVGATCRAGVCTGGTGSISVATARLKRNTGKQPRFYNGSVFVKAVVFDGDTGGTLPDNLVHGGVTLDVQDGSATFYSPQPIVHLTSCTKNKAGTSVRCNGVEGSKITATFTKIRYFSYPYGYAWKMTVRCTGLATGAGVPIGPFQVTLHQGPVDRSDSPSLCSPVGANTEVCHHTS